MSDIDQLAGEKIKLTGLKQRLCNTLIEKGHKKAAERLGDAIDAIISNVGSGSVISLSGERNPKILFSRVSEVVAGSERSLSDTLTKKIDPIIGTTAVDMIVDSSISEIERISGISPSK